MYIYLIQLFIHFYELLAQSNRSSSNTTITTTAVCFLFLCHFHTIITLYWLKGWIDTRRVWNNKRWSQCHADMWTAGGFCGSLFYFFFCFPRSGIRTMRTPQTEGGRALGFPCTTIYWHWPLLHIKHPAFIKKKKEKEKKKKKRGTIWQEQHPLVAASLFTALSTSPGQNRSN